VFYANALRCGGKLLTGTMGSKCSPKPNLT